MKPLVSICCITYNHAEYIQQAFESFLSQEADFEFDIIVHDDASNDGTQEIIKSYKNRYPHKITAILQQENQWSKGIKIWPTYVFPKATGRYIALCEGDDFWIDTLKLQKQIDFLEQNQGYVGAGCYCDRIEFSQYNKKSGRLDPRVYTFQHLYTTGIKGLRTCTMVYRRIGPFILYPRWAKLMTSGDSVILHEILAGGGQIYMMPFVGAVYRIHERGMWSSLQKHDGRKTMQANYEVLQTYSLKRFPHKFLFWWRHFKATYKHDIFHFNLKYLLRGFLMIFVSRSSAE